LLQILHKNIVAKLNKLAAIAVHMAIRSTRLFAGVVEKLGAWAAWSPGVQFPPAFLIVKLNALYQPWLTSFCLNALFLENFLPHVDGFFVLWSIFVAYKC